MSSELSPELSQETQPALQRLQENYRALRLLFALTLICILILSCALSLFFLREVSASRRQARELSRFVSDYQNNSLPLIMDLRARLQAFAQEHPDFTPILHKYFGPAGPALSPRTEPGSGHPFSGQP